MEPKFPDDNTVKITTLPRMNLGNLSSAELEMVLLTLPLDNKSNLNLLTNRVADFVSQEADQVVWQEIVKSLILSLMEKVEKHIPKWLYFFKGKISSVIVGFLFENLADLIEKALRKLGK